MRNRLTVIIASIAGAFCVYCAQNAMTTMDHDAGVVGDVPGGGTPHDSGFVADARGQTGGGTCCTAPGQTFTKLKEDDLGHGGAAVIDVSAYREVVLYANGSPCVEYTFLAAATSSPPANQTVDLVAGSAIRLQVNGPTFMVLNYCSASTHYVVNGVS